MKVTKAHFWAGGRIVLAVLLLGIIFKYVIPIRDTVHLKDGRRISGTFVDSGEGVVAIRTERDAKEIVIAVAEIAVKKDGELRTARGFIPLLRQITLGRYLVGFVMLGWIPWLASLRWKSLLGAQGITIGFWRALELTYLGLFCNNVMPGLTGGDVAKAYYASKLTSTKKTNAVVTVFLDRLIGLVMLGAVAGMAVCVTLVFPVGPRSPEYTVASYMVAAFMACSIAGGVAFFSRRMRTLGSSILKSLPGHDRLRATRVVDRIVAIIKRIDAAIFLYRHNKAVLLFAAGISVVAHTSAITAIYFFARALGVEEAALVSCFVAVPVAFIVSSIPVAPAGWGIGEMAFKTLFGAVGVAATAAITISVVYRLSQAVWTLPGGIVIMVQGERPTIEELEAEMKEDVSDGEDEG